MWLHSLKVAQLLRSAACLHTNQSRSYLNHLVFHQPQRVVVNCVYSMWVVRKCARILRSHQDVLHIANEDVHTIVQVAFHHGGPGSIREQSFVNYHSTDATHEFSFFSHRLYAVCKLTAPLNEPQTMCVSTLM